MKVKEEILATLWQIEKQLVKAAVKAQEEPDIEAQGKQLVKLDEKLIHIIQDIEELIY